MWELRINLRHRRHLLSCVWKSPVHDWKCKTGHSVRHHRGGHPLFRERGKWSCSDYQMQWVKPGFVHEKPSLSCPCHATVCVSTVEWGKLLLREQQGSPMGSGCRLSVSICAVCLTKWRTGRRQTLWNGTLLRDLGSVRLRWATFRLKWRPYRPTSHLRVLLGRKSQECTNHKYKK